MSGTVSEATVGVVVLTQGTRPADLRRGLESVLAQQGVRLDVVVVGNGWRPTGLPEGVKTLALPENLGIPAGRNAGVAKVEGELLFFLDDDAWLPDTDFLARAAVIFRTRTDLGMLQPRITDPSADDTPSRWVPRMRKGDPQESGYVFSVVEMAVVCRRAAFDATPSGWPAPFFYAHEGIELAWRIWDAGFRVWYAGDLRAGHPVIDPRRHAEYYSHNARNRVWLARRNLPWPVSWLYVASWTAVQLVRSLRAPRTLRPWLAGWLDGWRDDPWGPGEPRRQIRWSTGVTMARYGRPPVV